MSSIGTKFHYLIKLCAQHGKKNQVKKTTKLLVRHVKEMSVGAEMA